MGYLKQRRTVFGLTQQRLADALRVSQQTIARWESGDDIPSKYLKDLALVLDCRITDLIPDKAAANVPGARWADNDRRNEALYGTARLVFRTRHLQVEAEGESAGMGETAIAPADALVEYPVSERERSRLIIRLSARDAQATWLSFETLDNRMVFFNRAELELFELLGDDAEAAPSSSHEEIYRALLDQDVRRLVRGEISLDSLPEDFPYSERFLRTCIAVTEEWGDAEAIEDRLSGVVIETLGGHRRHVFSDPDDDTYIELGVLEVDLDTLSQQGDAPTSEWMVELGTEQYYRSSMYRLGSLRLIEAPLLPYREANRRAMEPMHERNGDGEGTTARAS